jgi:hypothetical protein
MRVLISLYLLLTTTLCIAETSLPVGCHALAVQGNTLTLQAKKNKMIFIHNITQTDLWITHSVTNPSTSAGWSSRLQGENWSALALDKGPFEIQCIESKPGHEQQVPCVGAIIVCQWNGVKFPKQSKGTYWAEEDMSLSALTTAIGTRGFVIPEAKKE